MQQTTTQPKSNIMLHHITSFTRKKKITADCQQCSTNKQNGSSSRPGPCKKTEPPPQKKKPSSTESAVLNYRHCCHRIRPPLICVCVNICEVPLGFFWWKIWLVFPGERQLWQSCATQHTVHAGCLSVSIIHGTLTYTSEYTSGSFTCIHRCSCMWLHTGVCRHRKRVCTGRWLRENSLAASRNRTSVSGMLALCSTSWATTPSPLAHICQF